MGRKFKKIRKVIIIFVIFTLVMSPSTLWAKGGFDFYFMGVKIKAFQGANWMKIAAGAAASILVHELGHALYLESRGKDWSVEPSSSGFAITTTDSLTNKEYRGLGRSGYLLQTGIGFLLTSFDATAKSDFTKGWVGINVIQTMTYNLRDHNGYDDFEMINRGQGNGESSYRLFSAISVYNFLIANSETGRVIFDVKEFQDKRRPMMDENSFFQFADQPNSWLLSMDTEISPSLSFDLFAEDTKELPKKSGKQILALLHQETQKPGNWQSEHHFQENLSQ
jgi:hypothetical protein